MTLKLYSIDWSLTAEKDEKNILSKKIKALKWGKIMRRSEKDLSLVVGILKDFINNSHNTKVMI